MPGQLLLLLGLVTTLLTLYTLVARSAGIFPTQRHFWRNTLISAALSYGLSLSLFYFFHVPLVGAFIVATIVPFLVSNFDGERPNFPGQAADANDAEVLVELKGDEPDLADPSILRN